MDDHLQSTTQSNVQVQIPTTHPVAVYSARKRHTSLWVLLALFLLIPLLGMAFFLGARQGSDEKAVVSEKPVVVNSTGTGSKALPAVHFVVSTGYPAGAKKKVVTTLGVPREYQAIDTQVSIQDQGLVEYFGQNFNASMGRWKFGYPSMPNGPVGEIGLVSVEDAWLSTARSEPYEPHATSFKIALNTVAQKKAYIEKIAKDTTECVKDKTKGFVLGSTVNVCYKLGDIRQAIGSYAPYTEFEGYGEKDGVKLYLYGTVRLYDGKVYTETEQAEFQKEHPADYAVAVQETFLASLKESKVVISNNN